MPILKMDNPHPSVKTLNFHSLNLKTYVSPLFKHKYKMLIVFLLCVLSSPGAYFIKQRFFSPVYEASAILMARYGREYSDVSPEPGGKTPLAFGRSDIFSAERTILQSRELKERIIASIGIEKLFPELVQQPPGNMSPQEAAMLDLARNLSVQAGRNANLIEIQYRDEDPELAARVVNLLVDFYQQKRMSVLADPKSTFFLDKKAAEYRQKVKESEDNLEAFRQKYHIFDFDSELSLLRGHRGNLEGAVRAAETQTKELQQKLSTLEEQIKKLPKSKGGGLKIEVSTGPNPANVVETLNAKLTQLKLKESELLTKYTEKSQVIVNTRNEIKQVEETLAKERQKAEANGPENTPVLEDPSSFNLREQLAKERITTLAELSSLEIRISDLKQELTDLQKKVQDLDAQENKWRELQRQVTLNEKYYQIYVNKVEEARISDDLNRQEMTSIQVLQSAVPPAVPVKYKNYSWKVFVAASVPLGLAAGIALVFLLEFLNRTISSPAQAEKLLGLPVLTTVSYKN